MFYETHRDTQSFYNDGNNHCRAHFHRSVEFLYVIEGQKKVMIDDREYTLSSSDLLVCPPFTVHTFLKEPIGRQISAVISSEYCLDFENFSKTNYPKTHVIHDSDGSLLRLVRALEKPQNKSTCIGVVNLILGIFQSKIEFTIKKKDAQTNIAKEIAEYVDAHYFEQISLAQISKAFGYSSNYFCELFKKLFRCTFINYVNFVRVRKSLKLLPNNKTLAVSRMVGFNSPQQYYLCFKKCLNCSPKEYLSSVQVSKDKAHKIVK